MLVEDTDEDQGSSSKLLGLKLDKKDSDDAVSGLSSEGFNHSAQSSDSNSSGGYSNAGAQPRQSQSEQQPLPKQTIKSQAFELPADDDEDESN